MLISVLRIILLMADNGNLLQLDVSCQLPLNLNTELAACQLSIKTNNIAIKKGENNVYYELM